MAVNVLIYFFLAIVGTFREMNHNVYLDLSSDILLHIIVYQQLVCNSTVICTFVLLWEH